MNKASYEDMNMDQLLEFLSMVKEELLIARGRGQTIGAEVVTMTKDIPREGYIESRPTGERIIRLHIGTLDGF